MGCVMRLIREKLSSAERLTTSNIGFARLNEPESSIFVWKDFSRFVQVSPVTLGWLVIWGAYRDMGNVRVLSGQRTYTDLAGVRRRVADSVNELTQNSALVAESLALFDRTRFPEHARVDAPQPI